MPADKDLIKFIKEARRRGFPDNEIRAPLLRQGWSEEAVDKAFIELKSKTEKKVPINISLPQSVLRIIEKRAKKNIMTTEEQIEDIVRRSAITGRNKTQYSENIDDLLVSIFSRKRR